MEAEIQTAFRREHTPALKGRCDALLQQQGLNLASLEFPASPTFLCFKCLGGLTSIFL